jgi:hypothetical protein
LQQYRHKADKRVLARNGRFWTKADKRPHGR